MKTLTKLLKSQLFAFVLALSLCLPLCVSEARAFSIGRSDGTWLFPLASNYYNSFSDWAGCPGMDRCPICGESHRNVNGVNWGDNAHSGQGGHNGIDIAAGTGTTVLAAAPGTVRVSTTRGGARGYYIVIEHPIDGTNYSYYSYYQHLSRLSVSVGQYVNAGAAIGAVGSTGGNYGAHLHFGIVMGAKGTNIAGRLGTIESYGWILTDGYREGRILNNPSAQSTTPRGQSAVVPPLNYHKGSTTYTFDASQVSIGGGTPITKPTDLAISTDKSTYTPSSTVTITLSASGATHYAISIWRGAFGTGERLYANFNLPGGTTFKPTQAGTYTIRADAKNAAGYISAEKTFVVEQPPAPVSQLKISPTAYPTGSLRKGSYFSLRGTISSNYTLSSVKGEILNASGQAVCSYTQYPRTTSFSLLNSGIDYNMTFNTLAPGNYTLRYTATDTSGKTVPWTSPMFTIESGLTISAGRYNPGTLRRGSYYSINGTVSSTVNLSSVTVGIYYSNGAATQYVRTAYPNSRSYNIYNQDYYMMFNRLAAGSYYFRVTASDVSGTSKTLVNNLFTVQ